MYMSFLAMALSVASMRYELAIPIPRKTQEALDLLVLSFVVLLVVCAAFVVSLAFLADGLTAPLGLAAFRPYMWLLPPGLFAAGAYQIMSYWAIREKDFSTLAYTKVSQSVGQSLVQIGLGALMLGPVGLIVGDVTGRTAGISRLYVASRLQGRSLLRRTTIAGLRSVAIRYRRFPLVSSIAHLFNTAGLQLPALLLAAFYGPGIAGLFAISQRAVGIPMRLLGRSIGQVYHGEAAMLLKESPERLQRLFKKTTQTLLLIGLFSILGLAVVAEWVFAVVFGSEWQQGGVYVQLLAPALIAQFVVSPVSQTSAVLETQLPQLFADAFRAVLVVAAIVIPSKFGYGAGVAVGVYSAAMLVSYLNYYVMYKRAINRVVARNVKSSTHGSSKA